MIYFYILDSKNQLETDPNCWFHSHHDYIKPNAGREEDPSRDLFDSLGVDFDNVDYDDVKKALEEINGGAGGGTRGGGVRGVHPSRVSRGETLPS